MPDPASTKQTTADLVAALRELPERTKTLHLDTAFGVAMSQAKLAADALKALAAENERLHGIEQRMIREIEFLRVYEKSLDHEGRRDLRYLNRILHGDANAGGGE